MANPASFTGRTLSSFAGLPLILDIMGLAPKQTVPPKTIMHSPSMEKKLIFGPVNIRLNMATIPFHKLIIIEL